MYNIMSSTFDPSKLNALHDALIKVFQDHPSAEVLKKRNLIYW
ncbi:hypothetical protein [Bacillus sp. FJAT-49736]|nr:hypothetical protein [Bacillus sp. FJAT-49736]